MKICENGVIRNMTAAEIKEFEAAARLTREQRIAELKRLLTESDYKTLKFVEGELSDTEYFEACKLRSQWRIEINKLEAEMSSNT